MDELRAMDKIVLRATALEKTGVIAKEKIGEEATIPHHHAGQAETIYTLIMRETVSINAIAFLRPLVTPKVRGEIDPVCKVEIDLALRVTARSRAKGRVFLTPSLRHGEERRAAVEMKVLPRLKVAERTDLDPCLAATG